MINRALRFFCSILSCLIIVITALPTSPVAGTTYSTGSFSVPLVITNVYASGIGSTYATVSWTTNGAATSQAFYDTSSHLNTNNYTFQTSLLNHAVTQHSVVLTGLTPTTTWHYRIKSTVTINGTAYSAVSDDYTFRTTSPITPPEPEPEPAPSPEPLPGEGEERVIAQIDTKREPSAQDNRGNPLPVSGDLITVTTEGETLILNIPVELPEGEELGSFTDAAGLTYQDNVLIIPADSLPDSGNSLLRIIDDNGELGTVIIIETAKALGTGTKAVANILSVRSVTGYTTKDFTAENPCLGAVSSTIKLTFKTIPINAVIQMNTQLIPDALTQQAFQHVAGRYGLGEIQIGYIVRMEKTNLLNSRDIHQAIVTMTAGQDCVINFGGADYIRIFRYDPETGLPQVLATNFLGFDTAGRAVFEGFSPNGLSVFGLVGIKPAPTGEPSTGEPETITDLEKMPVPEEETSSPLLQPIIATAWWCWLIIGIAAVCLIWFFYFLLRKSRKEKAEE